MKWLVGAVMAFLIAGNGGAFGQTTQDLRDFKAQALARFAEGELARGEGLLAVRLSLEAALTPDLSGQARHAAFGALARTISETDEFATLNADTFGLEDPGWMFGMFLRGGRYYVATAGGSPVEAARNVVLLVDAATGVVLDRRDTRIGAVEEISSDHWGNAFILVDGAGVSEVFRIEHNRLADTSSTFDFGIETQASPLDGPRHFLSEDGSVIYRIEESGQIKALTMATGEISDAPDEPTQVGPGKLFRHSRSTAVLSSRLDGELRGNRNLFRLAEAEQLAASRRLGSSVILNAATGETREPLLPPKIGRRAGAFALHADGSHALTRVVRDGVAALVLVDLNDPTFQHRFPNVAEDEIPIAFARARGHWLTATPTDIRTRDASSGKLIGWYRYANGAGRLPSFELGHATDVLAITEEQRIRFLRLFFENRPHSAALSAEGDRIVAAHRADPQNYISVSRPGGEAQINPLPDLDFARVLAGRDDAVAAIDTDGRFHYWPDGFYGHRFDPAIPPVDPNDAFSLFERPYFFGPDFLAIGGTGPACGLWSLDDWHQISGFTHAGCYVDRFVYDPARRQLAVLGGPTGNVSVYDTRSGEFLAHFRKQERLADTTNLSVSNAWFDTQGQNLHLVGSRGWQVDLDIETGALTWGDDLPRDTYIVAEKGGKALVTHVYDDDGERLIVAGQAAPIRPPAGWTFGSATVSPDQTRLAVVLNAQEGSGAELAIHDLSQPRHLFTYALPLFNQRQTIGVRFSPDGQWITAVATPGHALSFPASEKGLLDLAQARFGPLTRSQSCAWFLCR